MLSYEHDQDGVGLNQHAKYPGQRSFCSKLLSWHADMRLNALTKPLKWSVNRRSSFTGSYSRTTLVSRY